MAVGRLEQVPLRNLWPNEAYDFTTWLADNLDFVGSELGLALSLVEQEADVGPFSADLLAETGAGDAVVIENQLEATDHDHLGKLITYLSNLDAKAAIWITSEPRLEHEKAVQWLNELLPADSALYLLRVDAYRISDSDPAPLFTVVAGPSPDARHIGSQKKELAERHIKRQDFWTALLERANKKTSLHSQRSPTTGSTLTAGAGKSGIVFLYRVRMHDADVGLRIRRGKPEDSRHMFGALYERRAEIEDRFGGRLEWRPKEDLKACFVVHRVDAGGWKDEEDWPRIHEKMADAMARLEQALAPEIKTLP